MKKVMVGILVIIPVIIVLVVALVSVFVSMSAHIAVDDITLDKNYLEIEYDPNNSVRPLSELFDVTVTPDRASNKAYSWSIEKFLFIDPDYEAEWKAGTVAPPAFLSEDEDGEEKGDPDDESDDTCSQDGFLHINTYCSFVLKVQAETHIATCTVYVVGFKVESIKVNCDNLTVGENARIEVEPYPVEAIVDTYIYESSDDSVLTVDKNGVVNAVGAGTATVTVKASVYGEEGRFVEKSITITVGNDVTSLGANITTSSDEILFSQLGVKAEDVNIDASIGVELNSSNNGIILVNNLAVLVVKGEDVVISKCEDNAIVIDNANLFEAKDEGGYVLETNGKLYLNASFADDFKKGKPSVTWSSNRETIAKVDENGVVTGINSGRAIITATSSDGMSASVTINVQEVVTILLVETPDACKGAGIARETINASMVYEDVLQNVGDLTFYVPNTKDFNFTKKDNSFEFNFQRPILPEGVNAEEFYSAFSFRVQEYVGEGEGRRLQDTDKARFESNRMIFNGATIDGLTELVVTISANYPKFPSHPEYTTIQFTIKVTKGISVTSWVDMLAVSDENYHIYQANKTAEVKTPAWDIVLEQDITRADGHLPDDELISKLEAIETKVKAGKNLNTEESKLWADKGESAGLNWLKEMRNFAKYTSTDLRNNLYGNGHMIYGFKSQYAGTGDSILSIATNDVVISNVIIRACEVGDLIIKDVEDTQGLTGNCIRLEAPNSSDFNNRVVNNRIEYCILENTGTAIRSYNAEFTLDGCIVRNTSETAMYVPINRNESGVRYSYITVNNCVFSNMLGTAMSVQFKEFSDFDDPASVEQALKDVEAGKTFVLKQTGFWDIYNWQPTSTLDLIPEIEEFNGFIRGALDESTNFKKFSRVHEQTEYFHLGFVIAGFDSIDSIETPYPVCLFEDKRFQKVSTLEIFENETGFYAGLLKGILNGRPVYLYTYGQNGNLTPSTTYEVNNRLIRHLHGEV